MTPAAGREESISSSYKRILSRYHSREPQTSMNSQNNKQTSTTISLQSKPDWRDPITGMEFVWIPAGSFLMGSPPDDEWRYDDQQDQQQHHVTIAQGFYLSKYLVTQAQLLTIMSVNPSTYKRSFFHYKSNDLPVETVSWLYIQNFIKQLNHKTGQSYTLPTEAEWEYAYRAGTTTPYYTGHVITAKEANFSSKKTTPVGSYPPNPWGLYDMAGNVWEWTASIDDSGYQSVIRKNNNGVLRGGAWNFNPKYLRAASRFIDDRNTAHYDYFGFRLSRM